MNTKITSKIVNENCLTGMKELEENSIDTIITDPPYGLSFMGKDWDHGVPGVAFWEAALHVAKPGAMLFTFGGTRTVHRLTCAIEDAGWIIRDRMAWIYGSGFPKSHNISKAIDKAAGVERGESDGNFFTLSGGKSNGGSVRRSDHPDYVKPDPATDEAKQWDGYGTALKPAHEIIIVAMKPLDGTFAENALKWGVAGLWIDGGRVPTNDTVKINTWDNGAKPFGGGAGNDFTGRVETKGRFPANLLHDGSDEVLRLFPGVGKSKESIITSTPGRIFGAGKGPPSHTGIYGYNDNISSAARFFYCAKASKSERNAGLSNMQPQHKEAANFRPNHLEKAKNGQSGNPYGKFDKVTNNHPTVKPIALMRYLARLSRTPFGGTILDPFCGSGSTGIAAKLENRSFVGFELDERYCKITEERIKYTQTPLPIDFNK